MNTAYIKEFYHNHIDMTKGKASGDELRAPCPYHQDKNPSFSVNLSTGVYKCFKPGCKLFHGGNIQTFLSIIEGISIDEADARVKADAKNAPEEEAPEDRVKVKAAKAFPFAQEHILQRVEALMNDKEVLDGLIQNTKWTMDTIKRFEIGYDRASKRFWIPIKENNRIVNIRRYHPNADPKVLNITGFGEARLFPFANLENRELFLMEGEKDCILANQHGFNAITVTSGAGTFTSAWKQYFVDKDVVICYDIDEAGVLGAKKVADNIAPVARSLRVVALPIDTPPNGDYTDYITQGATPADFRALVEETPLLKPEHEGPIRIPDEVFPVSLDQLAEKKMFYRRVKMNVRVISKDSSPSIVPKEITVTCNHDAGRPCFACDVGDKGNKASIIITESMPEILQLIECTTKERKNIIRDIFRIPVCKKFKTLETDHQAIVRCSIIPAIDDIKFDKNTYNQKYVEREMFFLEKTLEANMDYEVEAIAMPDPKDQSLVHLGYSVKLSDSSIEEFRMTPELKKQLEIFQCPSETK